MSMRRYPHVFGCYSSEKASFLDCTGCVTTESILSGPTLSIPYPSRNFYIKTYWSKDGIVAVLLQSDVSDEARKKEAQEKAGGNCEFDKSLEVMRLRPISFISRSTVLPL